ncbi:hypothetical protein EST38_g1506 [Candolleomyces aberdarensis]|uniref:RRM domain-containing protein n=1 Tax=Candolleomyces aberdarensis TaxID=2316362 RepID=A0A4Q2DVM1_9AGAR|nr:hypothetical protein EST38_g1506 [Candolleomyces aberdarensis]
MNIQPEFTNEFETTKLPAQHAGKLNAFGTNNYRASFTSYPNSNRTHPINTSTFRDTHNFYQPTNDVFSPQSTSSMQSYDSHGSFDFGNPQAGGLNGHKGFLDSYNANAVSLLSHHNNPKTNGPMLQQQAHGKYTNPHQPSGSVRFTSQTPYGPHIPVNAGGGAVNGPTAPTNTVASAPSNNPPQEEISTIFVVGFPEDMQEREFQNMFTFSPGFEAATLKIPNKEYTSYGARGYQGYSGSNDPYNLVTVNQGGVVVDGGRDGTMSSWPAPGDDGTSGHFVANGGNQGTRKQIIGFAKFKSREYALEARDVLQGRRVDIEKGAVLKAEMAKKNLHTKRGVGPVAGPALTGPPPPPNQLQNAPHMNGVNIHVQEPFVPNDPYARPDAIDLARPGAWRDQLQRDVHAVTNGIGSGYSDFHLRSDREEEELRSRRERESSLYSAMGFPGAVGQGSATRGPRERAEEEERRRKEKESLRLSASNAAFDAFHSVPIGGPPPLSRQNSGINGVSLMPPPMESGSSLASSPHLANAFAAAPNVNQQSAFNAQHHEELAGPWDHVAVNASRSSSQRSTSPEDEPLFSPPGEGIRYDATQNRATSESSSSSVAGSQTQGVIGGPGSVADDSEIDLSKVMTELVLNTDNGTTSPQLPSPASGASSRNAVDQNPPINTLYVGNLPTSPAPLGYPPEYLEDAIRQLFSQQPGYRRLCYRQKNNGPMCFVEFADVNYATKALNELYGNTLNGLVKHGGIRLSYSKNPLGVRTPTSATSPNGSLSQQQQAAEIIQSQQDQFRNGEENPQPTPTGVRRDGSAGNYGNSFMTSPPPRFTSPPATHFGQQSLTSVSNHFPHRANGGSLSSLYSYNLAAASGLGVNPSSTAFSPFGISSPPTIPEQSVSDELSSLHSSQHFSHRTFTPPVNNVEATRAG